MSPTIQTKSSGTDAKRLTLKQRKLLKQKSLLRKAMRQKQKSDSSVWSVAVRPFAAP